MKATLRNWKLAEVSAVILIVALMTCTSNNQAWTQRPSGREGVPQKCVTMDSVQWLNKINYLNYIVQKLRSSDLPSKETSFIIDSLIYPFQYEIYRQITIKTK